MNQNSRAQLIADGTRITVREGLNVRTFNQDPFDSLRDLWRRYGSGRGFLGYELGSLLEKLPEPAADDIGIPDLWFEFPAKNPFQGVGSPITEMAPPIGNDFPLPSSLSRDAYITAVKKAQEYISAGDIYQVNLSRRLSSPFPGDPVGLFEALCRLSPAPYAAYLDAGDFQILSSSPELFLKVSSTGQVMTRPIKGTKPRHAEPGQDNAGRDLLWRSPKEQAELLMIVDLERNDLGRICRPGSIRVSDLRRIESFAQVHHAVATIEGDLQEERDAIDALRACFPGGSITGAPKIRAMEIIRELEPVRRGVYTGAIGHLAADGSALFNIAIRTMIVKNERVHFHVGSGIVADSEPDQEYEETVHKARGMILALAGSRQMVTLGGN